MTYFLINGLLIYLACGMYHYSVFYRIIWTTSYYTADHIHVQFINYETSRMFRSQILSFKPSLNYPFSGASACAAMETPKPLPSGLLKVKKKKNNKSDPHSPLILFFFTLTGIFIKSGRIPSYQKIKFQITRVDLN